MKRVCLILSSGPTRTNHVRGGFHSSLTDHLSGAKKNVKGRCVFQKPHQIMQTLKPAKRILLSILFLTVALSSGAATLVHDFYLPMPEAQIRQTFTALETGIGTNLDTTFSIVGTGDGTVIYYDQW